MNAPPIISDDIDNSTTVIKNIEQHSTLYIDIINTIPHNVKPVTLVANLIDGDITTQIIYRNDSNENNGNKNLRGGLSHKFIHSKTRINQEQSFFLNLMSVKQTSNGRATNANFNSLVCVLFDNLCFNISNDTNKYLFSDLPVCIKPWLLVETSPNNYQVLAKLSDPIHDLAEAKNLMLGLKELGIGDSGAFTVNRLFRAGGTNLKHGREPHTVKTWLMPECITDTSELRALVATQPPPKQKQRHTAPKAARKSNKDELLDWLVANKHTIDTGISWLDVPCPWSYEHTGATDYKAYYSPLGRLGGDNRSFKCHHSHDMHTQDYIDHCVSLGSPKVKVFCDPVLQEALNKYALNLKGRCTNYLDLADGMEVCRYGLDTMYIGKGFIGGKGKKPLMSKALSLTNAQKEVKGRCYIPYRYVENVPQDKLLVKQNGALYYNTFKYQFAPDPTIDITPFLRLLEFTIPNKEHRDLFVARFAFDVQYPFKKASWSCRLYSKIHGTGKNTLLTSLTKFWGSNAVTLDPEDIIENFSNMVDKKIVIINEGEKATMAKIQQELKGLSTSNQGEQLQKAKYETSTKILDVVSISVTSNDMDGLGVVNLDRRAFCIELFKDMNDSPINYVTGLSLGDENILQHYHDWLELNFRGIFSYLLELDISQDINKFSSRPPDTPLYYAIQDLNSSDDIYLGVILEKLKADEFGFVHIEDILNHKEFQRIQAYGNTKKHDSSRVKSYLRNNGFVCAFERKGLLRTQQKIKGQTKQFNHFYVIAKHDVFKMSNKQRIEAFKKRPTNTV